MKSILFFILTMAVYMPTDAERARWTMFDMRSWKTAFDAYKMDHGAYPNATTFERLGQCIPHRIECEFVSCRQLRRRRFVSSGHVETRSAAVVQR